MRDFSQLYYYNMGGCPFCHERLFSSYSKPERGSWREYYVPHPQTRAYWVFCQGRYCALLLDFSIERDGAA